VKLNFGWLLEIKLFYQVYMNRQEQKETHNDTSSFKVFVGGLSLKVTEPELKEYLEQFGQVKTCEIALHKTNSSKGYAFACFVTEAGRDKAIGKQHYLKGKQFEIRMLLDSSQNTELLKEISKRKLFISNLRDFIKEKDLQDLFSSFGEIEEVLISRDPVTQLSKGFGFVVFKDEGCVRKVLESSSKKPIKIKNQEISIKEAIPKGELSKQKSDGKARKNSSQYQEHQPAQFVPYFTTSLLCDQMHRQQETTTVPELFNMVNKPDFSGDKGRGPTSEGGEQPQAAARLDRRQLSPEGSDAGSSDSIIDKSVKHLQKIDLKQNKGFYIGKKLRKESENYNPTHSDLCLRGLVNPLPSTDYGTEHDIRSSEKAAGVDLDSQKIDVKCQASEVPSVLLKSAYGFNFAKTYSPENSKSIHDSSTAFSLSTARFSDESSYKIGSKKYHDLDLSNQKQILDMLDEVNEEPLKVSLTTSQYDKDSFFLSEVAADAFIRHAPGNRPAEEVPGFDLSLLRVFNEGQGST